MSVVAFRFFVVVDCEAADAQRALTSLVKKADAPSSLSLSLERTPLRNSGSNSERKKGRLYGQYFALRDVQRGGKGTTTKITTNNSSGNDTLTHILELNIATCEMREKMKRRNTETRSR